MCAGKRILLSSVERTRASSCQRTPPRNPPSEPTPPTVTSASLPPPTSFPSATLPTTLSLSRVGFLSLATPCNPPRVLSGTPDIEENRMKRETLCEGTEFFFFLFLSSVSLSLLLLRLVLGFSERQGSLMGILFDRVFGRDFRGSWRCLV